MLFAHALYYPMRMPSETNWEVVRRSPQLARGEHRVSALLDAAAAVIEEVGYEAATMTAIAERAHSSIGAVYQYYRDKPAIAAAVCDRFGEELARELETFSDRASLLDVHEMIPQLVQLLSVAAAKHPALMLVMHVSRSKGKEPAFRRKLRLRLADLFQSKSKRLNDEEAYRIASVVMQVLKSLSPLAAEAGPSDREEQWREIELLLTSYLETRLSSFSAKASRPQPVP